jgi:hypothetical protein
MSLYDYINHQQQNNAAVHHMSTGSTASHQQQQTSSSAEITKPPRKRRDDTNLIINQLYDATCLHRPGEREIVRVGGRKNKNEILGLANARLVKDKHLNGVKYLRDIDLVREIQSNSNHEEFVLVLRTDGRIVAMSDEVEHHLGKTMRALYTQCINIFQCLDDIDRVKLGSILESPVTTMPQEDFRLICTFRLPKGKRPSRTREDIKTIAIAGHFYTGNESSGERLFIARCEALLSRTAASSVSQSPVINNNTLKMTLNDDMTISMISSNVRDLLGYAKNEMIATWFGRYLTTENIDAFDAIRRTYSQKQHQPGNVCHVFDMYTNHGDGRLTFLCQIRPIRERRSKAIKFAIVAQLIDPSLRNEYVAYVRIENEQESKSNKVKVNRVPTFMSVSKASEDNLLAYSPSLAMGLLLADNSNTCSESIQQQQSPSFARSLSNVVAPFIFNDEFTIDDNRNNFAMSYWSAEEIDQTLNKCQYEYEIANIDEFMNEYMMNGCY